MSAIENVKAAARKSGSRSVRALCKLIEVHLKAVII
jgi:hypothetical protein